MSNNTIRTLITPMAYEYGERLITYVIPGAEITTPARSIESTPDCFFALQLKHGASDRIELSEPVLQDAATLFMLLNYLSRRVDFGDGETLRCTLNGSVDWGRLREAEMFVFGACDRNPFWTGLDESSFSVKLCGQEVKCSRLVIQTTVIWVFGPDDFFVEVRFPRHAEFPLEVNDICCFYNLRFVACRGVLSDRGYLRIKAVSRDMWRFECVVALKREHDRALLYGE